MTSKQIDQTVKIFERDTTITPSRLRTIGYIPATIYGKGRTPKSIQIKAHEFELMYYKGQRQFQLEGLGENLKVEAKQVQAVSTKQSIMHIEFTPVTAESIAKQEAKDAKAQKSRPAAEAEFAPESEAAAPEVKAETPAPEAKAPEAQAEATEPEAEAPEVQAESTAPEVEATAEESPAEETTPVS